MRVTAERRSGGGPGGAGRPGRLAGRNMQGTGRGGVIESRWGLGIRQARGADNSKAGAQWDLPWGGHGVWAQWGGIGAGVSGRWSAVMLAGWGVWWDAACRGWDVGVGCRRPLQPGWGVGGDCQAQAAGRGAQGAGRGDERGRHGGGEAGENGS